MDELEKWIRDKPQVKLAMMDWGFSKEGEKFLAIANLLASNRAEIETLKDMIAEMQK